jgi:hypothetical protein
MWKTLKPVSTIIKNCNTWIVLEITVFPHLPLINVMLRCLEEASAINSFQVRCINTIMEQHLWNVLALAEQITRVCLTANRPTHHCAALYRGDAFQESMWILSWNPRYSKTPRGCLSLVCDQPLLAGNSSMSLMSGIPCWSLYGLNVFWYNRLSSVEICFPACHPQTQWLFHC